MSVSRPGYVYRAFDADESLLYVGTSLRPGRRFAHHQSKTTWWDEVANISSHLCAAHMEQRLDWAAEAAWEPEDDR